MFAPVNGMLLLHSSLRGSMDARFGHHITHKHTRAPPPTRRQPGPPRQGRLLHHAHCACAPQLRRRSRPHAHTPETLASGGLLLMKHAVRESAHA